MKSINVEKSSVKEWISELSAASKKEHYPKLWKRVHELVAVPARRRVSVSLRKIERYTKEGDNVVVPGKVLSNGEIRHKVTIAAIEFSEPALRSLKGADCRVIGIKEMLSSKNVRVIV